MAGVFLNKKNETFHKKKTPVEEPPKKQIPEGDPEPKKPPFEIPPDEDEPKIKPPKKVPSNK